MLPKREHRRKVWGKRLREWKQWVHHGYTIVRPVVLGGLGYAGGWLFFDQLRRQVWHHNMIVWVLGLFVLVWGLGGLYMEIARRVRLRNWLRRESPRRVLEEAPTIRKAVDSLPPWHLNRYLEKKRWARREGKK